MNIRNRVISTIIIEYMCSILLKRNENKADPTKIGEKVSYDENFQSNESIFEILNISNDVIKKTFRVCFIFNRNKNHINFFFCLIGSNFSKIMGR